MQRNYMNMLLDNPAVSRVLRAMIEIVRPKNEIELAMIRGILEDEGIPYFVRNDYFGSLLGGPLRYDYNEKAVLVDAAHAERARELLLPILEEVEDR